MIESAKLLVQIASTEYLRGSSQNNLAEAVKYYEHALLVLDQIEGNTQDCDGFVKWLETAKVRVSLGQIYKQMQDRVSAFDHFQKAAECISRQ